jgi:hypothetical protein
MPNDIVPLNVGTASMYEYRQPVHSPAIKPFNNFDSSQFMPSYQNYSNEVR